MSKLNDKDLMNAGDISPSQLITTFGPGSVVNMRHDTVMIVGCHRWPKKEDKKRYIILHHELLQKKLKTNSFRMPLSHERSKNVPCFSFPRWSVCKNKDCQRLQTHESIPKTEEGHSCWSCERNGIKSENCRLTHARFVVICPKGHIDEFPWVEWVHHKNEGLKCLKNPNNPQLKFSTKQESSALRDYVVTCLSCYKQRRCTGATDTNPFKEMNITCKGKKPWIHPGEHTCTDEYGNDTVVRGIQVRTTSLWYSIVMSAIKVPRWLHPVNVKLEDEKDGDRLYGAIQLARQSNKSYEDIYNFYQDEFRDVAEIILDQKQKESNPNSSPDDIKNEIIQRLEEIFDNSESEDEIPTQLEILNQEYDDFVKIDDTKGKNYENEFQLRTSDIDKTIPIFSYLDSLKQINRITNISVLRGFSRGTPPDLIDPDENKLCKITSEQHLSTEKWLPAVQTRGEGIFLTLDKALISKWEKNEKLEKRCKTIIRDYTTHFTNDEEKQEEIMARFNSKFILLHTLSHLIIKALAAEAGYNEPSLKERIYWDDEDRNGILIYATGSSEGSLGGLVRLAQTKLFEKILTNAIQKSEICSRDPVCEDTDPTLNNVVHQLNGAACHSCCFLSETSCQFFNQFLDRWTINNDEAGFFKDYING